MPATIINNIDIAMSYLTVLQYSISNMDNLLLADMR